MAGTTVFWRFGGEQLPATEGNEVRAALVLAENGLHAHFGKGWASPLRSTGWMERCRWRELFVRLFIVPRSSPIPASARHILAR